MSRTNKTNKILVDTDQYLPLELVGPDALAGKYGRLAQRLIQLAFFILGSDANLLASNDPVLCGLLRQEIVGVLNLLSEDQEVSNG